VSIESLVGEVMPETFTSTDRTELITHGLELRQLKNSVEGLKILLNASLERFETEDREKSKVLKAQDADNEKRIRYLEDERLKIQTQLNIFKWLGSLVGPLVAAATEVALHIYWK
jgi:hypothetical protein